MIDLSVVPPTDLYEGNHEIHRPIKTQCDEEDVWIHPSDSSFLAYHYPGTLEAFQFRDDPRKGDRRTARHYYEKYSNPGWGGGDGDDGGIFESDGARFWIQNFVAKVGLEQAQILLDGASVVGLE
jgi:hypothetical protein